MVVDIIENAGVYFGLGKRIEAALKFIERNDFSAMKPGRYGIDGENIYALVQEYETRAFEDTEWEAHREYIDIQFMASGKERIGYANIHSLSAIKEYDKAEDCTLFEGEGDMLRFSENMFIILAPGDVHRPGIMAGEQTAVRKVVIKVRA